MPFSPRLGRCFHRLAAANHSPGAGRCARPSMIRFHFLPLLMPVLAAQADRIQTITITTPPEQLNYGCPAIKAWPGTQLKFAFENQDAMLNNTSVTPESCRHSQSSPGAPPSSSGFLYYRRQLFQSGKSAAVAGCGRPLETAAVPGAAHDSGFTRHNMVFCHPNPAKPEPK